MRPTMTNHAKHDALRRLALFATWPEDVLSWLAAQAEEASVAPGAVLVHEGQRRTEARYVILSGEAIVVRNGATVTTVREGAVLGNPNDPPATITATTLMHLLVVPNAVVEDAPTTGGTP